MAESGRLRLPGPFLDFGRLTMSRDDLTNHPRILLRRYGCAVAAVAVATLVRLALDPILGIRVPFITFYAAILVSAWYGGVGPSLVAVGLSWWIADHFVLQAHRSMPMFAERSEIIFRFFASGLMIVLLSALVRAAWRRAGDSASAALQALEAERAQRQWLRITLDSIADAVITADCQGCVTLLNPVAERLTGWGGHEAAGRPLEEVFCPVGRESATTDRLSVAGVVWGGEVMLPAGESVLVARNGVARCVEHKAAPIKNDQGAITGVVITFRDVTDRLRAEQSLRASEERFRTLADATPVMIWGADTTKLCTYFNKNWLEFTGRTAEQEAGDGWSEGVHPDDRARCLETYVTAFDARRPFTMEYRLRRHDGQYRWVIDTGVPKFTLEGAFSGYIGSCIDISDRKEAEEEVRKSDRRKEEFLAILSHELRNPLASIQTALDLMRQAGTSSVTVEQERLVMARQVRHLTRLVDDLLDVSRISRGRIELQKETVDLATALRQAAEAILPQFHERAQQLAMHLPQEPIRLLADPTRLEQVLINLLSNASKYTDCGGRVTVIAERNASEVLVRVQDTGIGIEPEILPRVFDPFVQGEHRGDRSRRGVGIGLGLVKKLVEMHGGSVTADSDGPGTGSEFTVRLPVLPPAPAHDEATPPPFRNGISSGLRRRRILIVDDNTDAADGLARLLTVILGQDVRVVYDGPSALDLVDSFRPEVILLDLGMAVMDGYEVAMRLRERPDCAGTVIVAVTGWGQEEDRIRSRQAGIDLHLVKPVSASVLSELLAQLGAATAREPACNGSTDSRAQTPPGWEPVRLHEGDVDRTLQTGQNL
jgi:PAS domain S-box-containing protein